jgi:hypothetical protein
MKKVLFIIILVLSIIFLIYKVLTDSPTEFNKVELDANNLISNRTSMSYYDTIANLSLNLLNIKGVSVIFKNLDKNQVQISDVEILAHITGNNNQYIVYIDKLTREKAIEVISHEMIHLEQIKNKKLVKCDGYSIWNDIEYPNELSYKLRPWEIDAYVRGPQIEKKIKNILIKSKD